jgi:pyruvate/2-oxoglutarate dehydrogenase complex dihydrolipoamide acyltransferase (E2) component
MHAVQKEHEVELVPEIHIGVAVSLEEGLLVPTIHRVIDGAPAAALLHTVKGHLKDP